jgi:hypothetical protein
MILFIGDGTLHRDIHLGQKIEIISGGLRIQNPDTTALVCYLELLWHQAVQSNPPAQIYSCIDRQRRKKATIKAKKSFEIIFNRQ